MALENGRISDFHGLVTLTLTSYRVILHTVMHHSSTSTYILNFIEIEEAFCGRTDIWDPLKPLLGRLGGVDLITDSWAEWWMHEGHNRKITQAKLAGIVFTMFEMFPATLSAVREYAQVWNKCGRNYGLTHVFLAKWPLKFEPVHLCVSA